MFKLQRAIGVLAAAVRGRGPAGDISMHLRGKRILVTGGAGFIGSHRRDDRPRQPREPSENTILELAETIIATTGSRSEIIFKPLPGNDPCRKKAGYIQGEQNSGLEPEGKFGLNRMFHRAKVLRKVEYWGRTTTENLGGCRNINLSL